ncbi:MAG: penicillin acylase family protein [Chloroflexi bacterium]|nr:penicillin acylase family protein [Chloroflexota bacterium]
MSVIASLTRPALRLALTTWGRRSLSRRSGTHLVEGLSAHVKVLRDRWGVPHIYAESTRDAFFAQGYVHAQDRLFQMDLRRRAAMGMLSEVSGPNALPTDRFSRTLGLHRSARADWTGAKQEVREAFQAYADGVNACMGAKKWKLPMEFSLLGYRPRPWEPADSMSFARLMTWQLAFGWHGELVRARLRDAVGAEAASEWDFHYPVANPVTLPSGVMSRDLEQAAPLPIVRGTLGTGGSNAWAIAGERSETGKPILCNDLHLFVSSPSVWYENHIVAPELEVTGASLPGIPAVLVGHNRHIAWGITAAFTDCQDLFAERFDGGDSRRYESMGRWVDAEVIEESIAVKGRDEPEPLQIAITRHGPLVADGPAGSDLRFALSAVALTGPGDAGGWIALNRARDWREFTDALRQVHSAQLNVVYADVEGNIGHRLTGRVPVRAAGDGTVPAPGWSGDHEWVGWVPFEEMPHALNPPQGVVVSANNKIVPDGYPHHLGNVWMNGFRAARISEVLAGHPKISAAVCRGLHADVVCIPGREFARRTSVLTSDDPDVRTAVGLLQDWGGKLDGRSPAAALFEVARHHLIRTVLAPVEDPDVSAGLTGVGPNQVLAPGNELYGNDLVAVFRMLDNPESWWMKRAGGSEAALATSLKDAVEWLRAELGPKPSKWRWGAIHRVRFPHPIGLRPPLGEVFDRGPYPIGGDMDTPAQAGLAPNRPYDARAACPSYRQVIDLANWDASVAIHAPGQSGQIGSRHYDDLLKRWRRGEYHPMLWTREQIEANAEARMRLDPAAPSRT